MHIYTEQTSVKQLRADYDVLVGWGTTGCFTWYYHQEDYPLDYLVDGFDQNIGKTVCGIKVSPLSVLETLKGKKVCIILYPNYEREIWRQIEQCTEADVIFHSLLVFNSPVPRFFSKNAEDVLMLNLARKLRITPRYLDIGVCHPILRNNTYLFYTLGYTGVLVEPNPVMNALAELYRPKDVLVKAGVAAQDGALKYYSYDAVPGLNGFFDADPYEGRYTVDAVCELPVLNINRMIEENFEGCPTILDLDVEGMQLEILNELDLNKYPVDIICYERDRDGADLLASRGYLRYASTVENDIWIRNCYSIELC